MSVDLPLPETPVTQVKVPRRKSDVDGCEVVRPRAPHRDPLPLLAGPRGLRHRDRLLPAQILPGQALPARDDCGGLAFGYDLAAMDARARPHVHDIVGAADRVLVMLDHEHGVAEVAKVAQRAEQARIVALVQADGGLVEHVEDPGQSGTDLRGEADALALAAGKRAGGPREREVFQTDIDQELQALVDLLQDAPGDLALLGRQAVVERREPARGVRDGEARDLADVQVAHPDAQRLQLQRWPLQLSHAAVLWNLPSSSRSQALSDSRQRRSRLGTTPSKGLVVLYWRMPSS